MIGCLSVIFRRIQFNGRLIPIDKQIVSAAQLTDSCEGNQSIQVWGELIKLNSDSSQVIQIHRKKGQAFGFFVARGTVNNVKGLLLRFISLLVHLIIVDF
jgi:hypothetical protein